MIRIRRTIPVVLLAAAGACAIAGCVTAPPMTQQEAAHPPPAAPLDARTPLTVDDAVRHALAADPQLRAMRHRVSAAYWRKVQASLPANPQLVASADPTEWAVRLSAHIADLADLGGRRAARVAAGQSLEEQAALEAALRQIEVTRQVRSDFAETWTRQRVMRLWRQRVDLHDQIVAVARRQRELGQLSRLDLLRIERQGWQARMSLREEELSHRQAEARLNRWLNLPLSTHLTLAMPDSVSAHLPAHLLEDAPIDLGLLRRPELAILAAQARQRQAMLTVARLQWMEGIEAGPYLKHEGGSTFVGGEIAITVPLFDRGQAQRGRHESELAALEQHMLATQAALLLQVHEAVLRLRHTRQSRTVDLPEIHRQAVAEHDLLRQTQELGQASDIDVRMARLAVLDAQGAVELARLAEWHAHAELAAALGDDGETLQGNDPHGQH
jgi:outer membrane protein, heavy metal efflux system